MQSWQLDEFDLILFQVKKNGFKYYNYNNPVLHHFCFFTELNAVHYAIAF